MPPCPPPHTHTPPSQLLQCGCQNREQQHFSAAEEISALSWVNCDVLLDQPTEVFVYSTVTSSWLIWTDCLLQTLYCCSLRLSGSAMNHYFSVYYDSNFCNFLNNGRITLKAFLLREEPKAFSKHTSIVVHGPERQLSAGTCLACASSTMLQNYSDPV